MADRLIDSGFIKKHTDSDSSSLWCFFWILISLLERLWLTKDKAWQTIAYSLSNCNSATHLSSFTTLMHIHWFHSRLPAAGEITNQEEMAQFKNESGFSWDLMRDLQRVLACLHVEAEGGVHTDGKFLEKVTGAEAGFAARVMVPMSAQGDWRLGMMGRYGKSAPADGYKH